MLELDFAGFFQVRLPTDPDPTDERRGVSGYTFAFAGEPDLDRVIRFQDPVAPRSHGPRVGVDVTAVRVDGQAQRDHPLVGARVRLLEDARFEMRNYVLTNDVAGTEAIDPFVIEVRGGGVTLRRRDVLDPANPAADILDVPLELLQRRGGALAVDETLFQAATGFNDHVAFRVARRERVAADLAAATDATARAGLAARLAQLDNLDPQDRPTRSLSFSETRSFAVNGPAAVEGADELGARVDEATPWPLHLEMGAWDCDALCGYARGRLSLPLLPAG